MPSRPHKGSPIVVGELGGQMWQLSDGKLCMKNIPIQNYQSCLSESCSGPIVMSGFLFPLQDFRQTKTLENGARPFINARAKMFTPRKQPSQVILKNYFNEQWAHRKNEQYKASLIILHRRTFSPEKEMKEKTVTTEKRKCERNHIFGRGLA